MHDPQTPLHHTKQGLGPTSIRVRRLRVVTYLPPSKGNEMPHAVDIHVGKRIRELRMVRNMSQSDLANALGITFQQVQKYEKGTNRVSASRLYQMCQALKVRPEAFFDGYDEIKDAPVQIHSRQAMRLVAAFDTLQPKAQSAVASLVEQMAAA